MLLQSVYATLMTVINSFDEDINIWIRSPRLNKPKGVLNYIVNHLKDLDDIIIKQKIHNLESQEETLRSIISDKIKDLDKKIKIISLMDGPFEEIPEDVCCVCKNEICKDRSFCEKKNWLGI